MRGLERDPNGTYERAVTRTSMALKITPSIDINAQDAKAPDLLVSMPKRRFPIFRSQSGHTASSLPIVLMLFVALGLTGWFVARGVNNVPQGDHNVGSGAAIPSPQARLGDADPAQELDGAAGRTALQREDVRRLETPPEAGSNLEHGVRLQVGGLLPEEDPSRFKGKGVLRGEVVLPQGFELEVPWTLVVGASSWLIGSETAVDRRIEFAAGERSFQLENLPLAGYQLSVQVTGWSGNPAHVLLQKRDSNVFVTIPLERNGTIEGSLFRDNGVGAEGIAVRLEPLTGSRATDAFESTIDINGHYRFEAVPDGAWRLIFGPPTSPLLPETLLELQRSGMVLVPQTLPPLGWFRLVVVDPAGIPVAGATISGSCKTGGVVRGETDQYGVFVGRNTPPGHWVVRVSHKDHGSIRKQFVVDLEDPYENTVSLLR
ncbi:MAG: hypothetical protein ACI8PQ_001471 [Planctomycetota bacterium]|jgi:hypothetical protein